MEKKEKTFSIKKLLSTILKTVMVTSFIASILVFIGAIGYEGMYNILCVYNLDSELTIKMADIGQYEWEIANESIDELKAEYGEDYPAEGLAFIAYRLSAFNGITNIYVTLIIIGVIVGAIIYIVDIQKANAKKKMFQLCIAFVVLLALIALMYLVYQFLMNDMFATGETKGIERIKEVFEFNPSNILIIYVIAAVVIYILNMIKQKIITIKLNKELNKK